MAGKPVAIIMGSQSDWATMKHAADTLEALGIGHESLIVSAHRTPDRLFEFGKTARQKGFKVVIAGAGGAAHLPGMTASLTPLPVFGVPMNTHALEGKDSLLSLAAARLGFKCHVFSPSPDSPAFDVVHRVTCADYTDTGALDRFAADVDVVTYEFENVPAETATFLSSRRPVLPDPKVLATTQDRLTEKEFVNSLGIGTAKFARVESPE